MGQDRVERNKEQRIASVISQASLQLGLRNLVRFSGGNVGVPLFVCEDAQGVKKVAKLGVDELTNTEVTNNQHGYKAIEATGVKSLVPGGITYAQVDGSPLLVMNHLGASLAERLRAGETNLYGIFLQGMESVYNDSLHVERGDLHELGITQIINEISLWQQRLTDAGYLPHEAVSLVKSLDVPSLAGKNVALMLSDFTPDNIFVENGQIKFIDPWKQETYLGTPIPGIAQFITLAADVHHFPGAAEMKREFEELAYRVGEKLGLTEKQVRNQLRLGKAMQLALSSFVRIGKDDALAGQFALESYNAVKGLEK